MEHYISKSALLAEIERLKDELKASDSAAYVEAYIIGAEHTIKTISDVIDTLEVKEIDEKPNPRFPHYEDIVDKVFGAGNLEFWEYSEAEMLVSLAKEELLKDLEVKEVDLELITGWFDHIAQIADDRMTLTNQRMTDAHALDEIKCLAKNSSEFITKHYKAQKGEKI